MTTGERGRFFDRVYDAFNAIHRAAPEGQPHRRAKTSTLQALVLHFKTSGRQIYVAEELVVMYPGQRTFTPDLLAVLDVTQPDPDEDKRMAWAVADEGKGPDFVLEVLHKGSRVKDLVKNVAAYAQLGISECFVYDLPKARLHGYRLAPSSSVYEELKPGMGMRLSSQVLGLNLGIVDRRLRVFAGLSELVNYEEYFERVTKMMVGIESRATEAQDRAERAELETLQTAILDLAEAYGLDITEAHRAQIAAADLEELQALRLQLKSRRAWS